jgi:hypothetical protein
VWEVEDEAIVWREDGKLVERLVGVPDDVREI